MEADNSLLYERTIENVQDNIPHKRLQGQQFEAKILSSCRIIVLLNCDSQVLLEEWGCRCLALDHYQFQASHLALQ